jgi:hypothetical protein
VRKSLDTTGLRVGIHDALERPDGVVFRCDLTASDANRWLEIPAWMFKNAHGSLTIKFSAGYLLHGY